MKARAIIAGTALMAPGIQLTATVPSDAADVDRGVLETFYPRSDRSITTVEKGAVAPSTSTKQNRRSDPGQDPYTLCVVLTDSVTDDIAKRRT